MAGKRSASALIALMAAATLGLGIPTPAAAQDDGGNGGQAETGDGGQAQQMPQGMGQGMMRGQGMMQGRGMKQGQGTMRGQGMMQGQGMPRGQGMMGPQGQGMMRGQQMGPGPGMGSGQGLMRGPGSSCPGCGMMGGGMAGAAQTAVELEVAEVRAMMEQRVALTGNPRLAVGNVRRSDAGIILAEIVTKDEDALVNRFAVNPMTGEIWPLP